MNGMLSPINGRPLGTQWQSDLEACFRKCNHTLNAKDKTALWSVHWVPPGPLTDVGNTGNPRGKISYRQFFHNLNLLGHRVTRRQITCEATLHKVYEEIQKAHSTEENKILPLR